MSDDHVNDVIRRLTAYQTEIRSLLALVGKSPFSQQDKTRAQNQLKALKERLKKDYREGGTVSGEAALNDVERAYFHPAIQQAFATIKVKWNSNPSQAWSSELSSALIDIEHALAGLNRQKS